MKWSCDSRTSLVIFLFVSTILIYVSSSEALEIPVGLDVRRMFTVDINYDGIDDLVIGGTDGVTILVADGHGGFEPPDPLSGAGLVGVADINEDGFLDIITTTAVIFGSSNSRWSIGPTHEQVEDVGGEVADFDKDGHIDFIARSTTDYHIYYGDGTGNFIRDRTRSFIGEFMVVQDVDGNLLPDLVQGGAISSCVFVYLNQGQRHWSDYVTCRIPVSLGYGQNVYRPAVADFTGDGIVDIIAGGYGFHKICLFEGNGDGTFQDAIQISRFIHVGQMATADFDKDGISDLVAAGYFGKFGCENLVSVIYGDATGQFARQTTLPLGSMHTDVATGDWNNDGWDDIATLSWTTDTVSILFNDGTGSFVESPISNGDDRLELAADFDGDGYKDIILRRYIDYGDYLYMAYGNADGTFGEPRQLSHEHLGAGYAVGYFDETLSAESDENPNRTLDIAYTIFTGGPNSLYVLLNRGNRQWSEPIRAAGNHDMDMIITGDFNEDGIQDIIDSGAHFLAGNGDGTFHVYDLDFDEVDTLAIAVLDDPGNSALDIDNDGHLDIVTVPESGHYGAWIGWGKGDGSFEFVWDERITSSGDLGYKNWLADVNNDGSADIVAQDYIWLNLGERCFSNALPFGGEPVDINGDGILDILKTYREQGCLLARFGDGNSGWSPPEVWIHGGWPSGDNIFYGSPGDPVENVLIGRFASNNDRYGNGSCKGFWTYKNPWRDVVVADTSGPRILDYIGLLNPGFTTEPIEFVLRISEPIDPATVHTDSVYLLSAGKDGLLGSSDDVKLDGTLRYDDSIWQITFIPDASLAEGPYRFVVSGEGHSAVSDLAGNALDGTVYEAFPSISGDGRPGGSFISTFYVVNSLPEPQELDSRENDVSDEPTSPAPIEFNSDGRATITCRLSPSGSINSDPQDNYFLGELTAGDVVTVDLNGWGAGYTLEGGAVSVLRHLPEGWVTFASSCLTDGFVDSHLSFPIRYDGEYILAVNSYSAVVNSWAFGMSGTYSVDIAVDSTADSWGSSLLQQIVFLDFNGSKDSPWGPIEPFEACHFGFNSGLTGELITSITDKVTEDFAQFSNIIITTDQPIGVDYSRINVGLALWIVDPKVDNWNLNHSDEGLVNSFSFWEMRHYGFDAVAQAIANTTSHQIGHLLGLQHAVSYRGLMNDDRAIPYWIQDHYFSEGSYWWASVFDAPEQDAPHFLEYNTGSTVPATVPPTIGSLIAEPNSVRRDEVFQLYPQDVIDVDGRIVKVEFYHDTNTNHLLDIGIDKYIWKDSSSPWIMTMHNNADFSAGIHTFLARAMDDDGAWSNVVSATVEIIETSLSIDTSFDTTATLQAEPNSISPDETINLDKDTYDIIGVDDKVRKLEFYRNENVNDHFEIGVDDYLERNSSFFSGRR